MENILLFGGGLHVSYCIDIIEEEGRYNIVGIADSAKDIGTELYGYKVIGRQEQLKELITKYDIHAGMITIGDNWSRKIVYDCIMNQIPDFKFVNAIHPAAVVAKNVQLGVGNVIMAGCICSTNSIVGDFCFMGTGAHLEHNCTLGDFASISAGSVMGGKVNIGKYSAITIGVIIVDRLNIGENTVVGSGSLVLNDLPDNVLAYGNPVKIIRTLNLSDKFLKSD